MQTVLCVDDDRNLCRIIAKALEGEGYEVRTANDGDAALESFYAMPPDLVLLDLLLPGRDGFEVLSAIRERSTDDAKVPALLISGCSKTPAYEEKAAALGVDAFLTKPVPLDTLLDQVRTALAGASSSEVREAPRDPPKVLDGTLEELPFPALLNHLHGLRATGALILKSGKKQKGIQMLDGRSVGVRSNQVGECLGNLLVRMGRIDRQTLQESLRRMKKGEGLQGDILVAMEVLAEDELTNALRVQAEEKLFEVFEWAEGSFQFRRASRLKGASTLGVERKPASIIVSGVTSRFPIKRIDAELRAHQGAMIVAGESPYYLFQDVTLESSAQMLLQRLTRGVPVDELLETDESSRRMLYALLCTQMVQVREGAPPDVEEAQAADAIAAARARLSAVQEPRPDPELESVRVELTALADRIRGKDFYGILGVREQPTDEEVRYAYVDLAKRTHPDRFSNAGDAVRRLAEEIFGLVSQAHESLADARAREAYRLQRVQGARLEEELEEGRRALAAEKEFQKGLGFLKARRYNPAFEAFKEAVELYPQEGEYMAYLGWTRFLSAQKDKGARKEAVKALKQALKLAPDSEKPYLLLGQLYKACEAEEHAERMFMKAVQQKPDCVEALRELRLINLRREKQKGLVRRLLRR
jgi:CheY-like chemotaxis protein/tetratricopeptide (TPR) repeat protein